MSPEQIIYLDRRRRQIRYWPWLAVLMLVIITGVFVAIWWKTPLQLNPLAILGHFRTGLLPDTELVVIAARGSLGLIACGLLLLVILLLISLSVDNERRLIAIIDQLSRQGGAGDLASELPGAERPEGAGAGTTADDAAGAGGSTGNGQPPS